MKLQNNQVNPYFDLLNSMLTSHVKELVSTMDFTRFMTQAEVINEFNKTLLEYGITNDLSEQEVITKFKAELKHVLSMMRAYKVVNQLKL